MIITQDEFWKKQINSLIMKTEKLQQHGINTFRIRGADAVQNQETEETEILIAEGGHSWFGIPLKNILY